MSVRSAQALPRYRRDDSAARTFMFGSAILIVLGVTEGLILALEFVFPDLFRGIPFLVFGRLRQGHTNTVMFAFLSMGMMGVWYYIVSRLTGRRLWSETLGNIAAILWGVAVLAGTILLLLGSSQGREYAEMVYATVCESEYQSPLTSDAGSRATG
jgi:cbb3-type cytochrome oxidase subunit 1